MPFRNEIGYTLENNMMKKLNLKYLALALGFVALVSCNNEDENANESRVQIFLQGSQTVKTPGLKATQAVVELDTFLVNISEIEFDVEEPENMTEAEEAAFDSIYDAKELDGPYLVDLMSPEALSGLSLGSALIPNAVYEEVEFEFEASMDETNEYMNGYSIVIEGSVDGVPFIFQTDEELEMEIEFPDQTNITAEGNALQLYIEINVALIVETIKAFDFSQAVLNEDGIIVISPSSENSEIAELIMESIEESVELDDDDDSDEDENDDDDK